MWRTSPADARRAVALPTFCVAVTICGVASTAVTRNVGAQSAPRVTFARDVAPILYARCSACHHEGGSAPFSLLTYSQVRPHAAQIAEVTRRRYMPPWKPDPNGSAAFLGANRLSDAELETIARWVSDGAPEGDPTALPAAPSLASGWKLGTPDLVVTLADDFVLGPDGTDVFRIFSVPLPTTALRYVTGFEFHPGNARVVHHANVRIDPTRTSRRFDDADPAPGYDGLIAHTATYPDGHFLGWTPGQVPPLLPKGLAWRLEPGSDLVLELHLQPSGKPELVKPEVGLYFGSDPPDRTPTMLRLGKQDFEIPAGAVAHTVRDSFVLPVDVTLEAVQPHSHQRARNVRAMATLPSGQILPILEITDWDFRWQDVYRYATPAMLPRGTTLTMAITFDNSTGNPRNPWNPPRRVYWGQRSADEMGDVWFQVLTRNERDRRLLVEQFRPKVLLEDTFGYEREIAREPETPSLRDSAAVLYLEVGNVTKALEHFAVTARLQPQSASAHFNHGTALTLNGRLDEGMAAFERALTLRPDYGQAHNNLGSLLQQRGETARAAEHFRAAIAADTSNAEAHRNLALIRRDAGDFAGALGHYRDALNARPDWPPAMTDLAWLLATSGDETLRDAAQARRLAERANDLTGRRDPAVMDVLAAAYAAGGDFTRATATAEAALALAPSGPGADAIRSRAALYRQRRAFVAPR